MNFLQLLTEPNHYGRQPSNNPVVAGILDDFSTASFSKTFDFYPVGKSDYRMLLEDLNPELLFIESAWNGNRGQWRYQLTSPTGPKPDFVNLTKVARELDIPVVFWNKEDPPHFEEFVQVASLADHIFTTESDLIPEYQRRTQNKSVQLMRFAAEPLIHRPEAVDGYREGDICFAGQYFQHKFPERREQMNVLFPAAEKYKFSIFSRALGGQEEYQFPERYEKFVVGSLPYAEMVKEYRRHKVFFNVNSVPQSQSMCARRIFELSAAKTLVMGMPTDAISSVYSSDEVILVRTEQEAAEALEHYLSDENAYLEATHKAWRRTLLHHTYQHRANEILQTVGLPGSQVHSPANIVIAVRSSDPSDIARELEESGIARSIAAAQKVNLISSVVVKDKNQNGFEYEGFSQESVEQNPVILMDTQNFYGENFVTDLALLAYQFPEADIITKPSPRIGTRLQETQKWGTLEDYVSGASLFASRKTLDRLRDSDSTLRIYLGDDFNFSSVDDTETKVREA